MIILPISPVDPDSADLTTHYARDINEQSNVNYIA